MRTSRHTELKLIDRVALWNGIVVDDDGADDDDVKIESTLNTQIYKIKKILIQSSVKIFHHRRRRLL